MNKALAIFATSLLEIAGFAQGRLTFANDSVHLVYYNPDVFPPPMGGSLVYNANMPAGATLVADLYLGTSSSALSLTTTTTFGSNPGEWIPTQVAVPGIPGGTTLFVKIQVRNAAFAPESTWTPNFVPPDIYWGFSVEFPFTLGSSITYPSIVAPPSPWPPGTYPIPGGGGALGAIPVGYVPEPSVLALAGFGAVAMLIFCRWSAPVPGAAIPGMEETLAQFKHGCAGGCFCARGPARSSSSTSNEFGLTLNTLPVLSKH